jgi:hypothetical protein
MEDLEAPLPSIERKGYFQRLTVPTIYAFEYVSNYKLLLGALSSKYEFASSNITRMTFAFATCFLWKLAPLADEPNGFFHRISIATINAIEHALTPEINNQA